MKTRLLKKLRRKFSRQFLVLKYGDEWIAKYDKREHSFDSERERDHYVRSIIYSSFWFYISKERAKQNSTKPRHPYFW